MWEDVVCGGRCCKCDVLPSAEERVEAGGGGAGGGGEMSAVAASLDEL